MSKCRSSKVKVEVQSVDYAVTHVEKKISLAVSSNRVHTSKFKKKSVYIPP
jgi:hypothetical protein